MNPCPRAHDRVALPSGKKGSVRRVQKTGFLSILCDDGSELVISPIHVIRIDEPPPVITGEPSAMRAELERLNAAIRRNSDELSPYRAQIRELNNQIANLRRERKTLYQQRKTLAARLRRSSLDAESRRAQRREWHAQHAITV